MLTAQQAQVLDRIVAVVGKEYILESDLNAQTEFFAFNNKVDPTMPGLKEQVLDAMVNEKLVLSEALVDTNLSVTDDEVSQQLDAVIAQRIALPQVGSEKRLEEMYGMPISKMKREFRDDMRKQLLVQKLQQSRFGSLGVSRREVEAATAGAAQADAATRGARLSVEAAVAHVLARAEAHGIPAGIWTQSVAVTRARRTRTTRPCASTARWSSASAGGRASSPRSTRWSC